jgi:hypothetical protein
MLKKIKWGALLGAMSFLNCNAASVDGTRRLLEDCARDGNGVTPEAINALTKLLGRFSVSTFQQLTDRFSIYADFSRADKPNDLVKVVQEVLPEYGSVAYVAKQGGAYRMVIAFLNPRAISGEEPPSAIQRKLLNIMANNRQKQLDLRIGSLVPEIVTDGIPTVFASFTESYSSTLSELSAAILDFELLNSNCPSSGYIAWLNSQPDATPKRLDIWASSQSIWESGKAASKRLDMSIHSVRIRVEGSPNDYVLAINPENQNSLDDFRVHSEESEELYASYQQWCAQMYATGDVILSIKPCIEELRLQNQSTLNDAIEAREQGIRSCRMSQDQFLQTVYPDKSSQDRGLADALIAIKQSRLDQAAASKAIESCRNVKGVISSAFSLINDTEKDLLEIRKREACLPRHVYLLETGFGHAENFLRKVGINPAQEPGIRETLAACCHVGVLLTNPPQVDLQEQLREFIAAL